MGKQYSHLSTSERNQLQRSLNQGMSLRAIARATGRSVSTLSRECRRGGSRLDYHAVAGAEWTRSHRRRGPRKLLVGSPLAELVEQKIIHHAWSPEQIAGRLRMEHQEDASQRVSHETIYQYIYAHPAGDLKKLLVGSLRQGHQKRRPRSRERTGVAASGTCGPSASDQQRRRPGRFPATGREISSKVPTMAAPSAPWWTAAPALSFWRV